MTGFKSKKAAAQDKLAQPAQPAQRTWVGLDELQKERLVLLICNNQELHELRELVDEIEAQLKEKNT
jgi:hypothetical protein